MERLSLWFYFFNEGGMLFITVESTGHNMLKDSLMILSFVCVGVLSLMYVFQRHFIYFPAVETPSQNMFHATDMTVVSLETSDNLLLHAWYKPAQPGQPTLLFLHGNAGHVGYRMPFARYFIEQGFGVFLLEYRGYGGNPGSPTEQGLYDDARAAVSFLQQAGITPDRIVVYGESLGTGVATQLAVEHAFCAVMLQSPFTSLVSLARYHYPWLPIKPRDQFDSQARIAFIRTPLLVLHGTHDDVVPFEEGQAMFEHANEPKKMLQFEGKKHNNLWNNAFYQEISLFMQAYCDPQR